MSDIFDLVGAQSALRQAQKLIDQLDVRNQALGHLDEILNVGRSSATQAMLRQVMRDMESAERMRDIATGRGTLTRALDEMNSPSYQRLLRDFEKAQLDFEAWLPIVDQAEWARRMFDRAATADFISDLTEQMGATQSFERMLGETAKLLPGASESLSAELFRSLDLDPVRRAAQDVAALLERIRKEEGEADNLDQIEHRISRARVRRARKAFFKALHQLLGDAKQYGLDAWMAFAVWYESLPLVAQVFVTIALSQSVDCGVHGHFTTGHGTASTAVSAPAAERPTALPVSPSNRATEVLYAEKDISVWAAPSTKQPVLARLPARQLLRVTKRQIGWYQVTAVIPGGGGAQVKGWVKAKGLKSADAESIRMLWCMLTTPDAAACADDED